MHLYALTSQESPVSAVIFEGIHHIGECDAITIQSSSVELLNKIEARQTALECRCAFDGNILSLPWDGEALT